MPLYQVYYTSCKRGLRGGAGFQINAASTGLDVPTLSLIERFSAYQPPLRLAYSRNIPIERFPRTLSYYRVGERFSVIARSVYLGATAADARGGNFFTHSLVSMEGPAQFGQLVPAQMWEADIWSMHAVDNLQLPEIVGPLYPALSPKAVAQFLLGTPERKDMLGSLIDVASDCVKRQRRLAIVATADECAYWIAAITMALPHNLAYELTFTTYARDVGQFPCFIVGLDPESFAATSRPLGSEYYVFRPPGDVPTTGQPTSMLARLADVSHWRSGNVELTALAEMCAPLRSSVTFETLDQFAALQLAAAGQPLDQATVLNLAYFARTLFNEPFELIAPLLARFGRLDAQDAQVQEASWNLVSAAHAAINSTAEKVIDWFADWVAEHFLGTASVEALERMGQRLMELPLDAERWQRAVPVFEDHIGHLNEQIVEVYSTAHSISQSVNTSTSNDNDELPLLIALLRLADTMQIGSQIAQVRRHALEILVAYAPNDQQAATYIAELSARQDEDTETALAQAALCDSADPARLARWQGLLANRAIRSQLIKVSIVDVNAPLFLACQIAERPVNENRTTSLVWLWQTFAQRLPSMLHDSDIFQKQYVDLAFPEATIAASEARRLLETLTPSFLTQIGLFSKIIAGLINGPNLLDCDTVWVIRQVRAFALSQSADTNHSGHTLQFDWVHGLCEWLDKVPDPTDHYEMDAARTRRLLQALPPRLEALRANVLLRLVTLTFEEPPIDHRLEVLFNGLAEYEDNIWRAMEHALEDRSQSAQSDNDTYFYELFMGLAPFMRTRDSVPATTALDAPLRRIWQGFPQSSKQRIDRNLRHSDARKIWIEWHRTSERRWIDRLLNR